MKKTEPPTWEAISSRIQLGTDPIADAVPYGFPTRVVGLWRAARRDEALRRWSLWSLRAALCSMTICGVVVFFVSRERESTLLFSPPSADFVSPPLSSH